MEAMVHRSGKGGNEHWLVAEIIKGRDYYYDCMNW
jgi:hypothetical protein